MALKRLIKEFNDWAPEAELAPEGFMAVLQKGEEGSPYDGIAADNFFQWYVVIPAPEGSPYESGKFVLSFTFPSDYPFKPMRVLFTTPVYHSWVVNGFVTPSMMPILGDQWSPALSALKVAQSLQCMLSESQAHGMDSKITNLYINNRAEHDRIVRSCVQQHAQVVPQSIVASWHKMYDPPLVLTLHVSSGSHASLVLAGTNMAGTQVASVIVDTKMDEDELRQLLAQQLDVPVRRLKMCLADGTFINSTRKPNGAKSQYRPIGEFVGLCVPNKNLAASAAEICVDSLYRSAGTHVNRTMHQQPVPAVKISEELQASVEGATVEVVSPEFPQNERHAGFSGSARGRTPGWGSCLTM